MIRPGAPLRFLALIIGGWCTARGTWLWLETDRAAPPPAYVQMRPTPEHLTVRAGSVISTWVHADPSKATPTQPHAKSFPGDPIALLLKVEEEATPLSTPVGRANETDPSSRSLPTLAAVLGASEIARLSGSAWLLLRPNGKTASIAVSGQLGASQGGAVFRWRLNSDQKIRTALYGRLLSPIEDAGGAELALGAEWRPMADRALLLAAERRIAIGRDGRNAFAVYAAGGIWKPGLPLGLIADGYAQAGIVGAHHRDLFADGALKIVRAIGSDENAPRLGVGIWGAAQPGISRVDIGPHAVLPLKLGPANVTLAADFRVRVAGQASPPSGVALTLATDF